MLFKFIIIRYMSAFHGSLELGDTGALYPSHASPSRFDCHCYYIDGAIFYIRKRNLLRMVFLLVIGDFKRSLRQIKRQIILTVLQNIQHTIMIIIIHFPIKFSKTI